MQSETRELAASASEFAGQPTHGPFRGPYELATHAQAVALVLAAGESVPFAHGEQLAGPTTSLNEPVGHAVHGSFECPTSQTQAAAVVLPDGEFELAAHGCATAACSTPPGGVPRQKEPGGQSVHALLFHR